MLSGKDQMWDPLCKRNHFLIPCALQLGYRELHSFQQVSIIPTFSIQDTSRLWAKEVYVVHQKIWYFIATFCKFGKKKTKTQKSNRWKTQKWFIHLLINVNCNKHLHIWSFGNLVFWEFDIYEFWKWAK